MPKLVTAPSPHFTSSTSSSLRPRLRHGLPRSSPTPLNPSRSFVSSHLRPFANARHDSDIPVCPSTEPWTPNSTLFSPTPNISDLNNSNSNNSDHKPPDERILKLGKTLRQLSPLLPTILINPLPPHLLSPSVSLHLFPSTHPHLPTVKGRTLYRAAIWAVPVAWSSVPLVGNVQLQILSERIVRAGTVLEPTTNPTCEAGDERLVVRWRTEHSSSTPSHSTDERSKSAPNTQTQIQTGPGAGTGTGTDNGVNKRLSILLGGDAPIFKLSHEDQFTGLFIFSFDEEGRVLTQTIEHAEDASGWERTAKFVTLTDWLIGKARGSLDPTPAPGGLAMGRYSYRGKKGEDGHGHYGRGRCFET